MSSSRGLNQPTMLIIFSFSTCLHSPRAFICETTFQGRNLATRFPTAHSKIPYEADLDHYPVPERLTLAASWGDNSTVGCFGREAQAAFLLDQVLAIVESGAIKSTSTAMQVDEDLWSFLHILLDQCRGVRGVCCGAIAIVLR